MRPLSKITPKCLNRTASRRGFSELTVVTKWHEIVPAYSAYSRPVKLYNGILTIMASSSSAARNMDMQGQPLIDRINQYFGYGAVRKLKFVNRSFQIENREVEVQVICPDDMAKNTAKERCSDVRDEKVREALERLGSVFEMIKRESR